MTRMGLGSATRAGALQWPAVGKRQSPDAARLLNAPSGLTPDEARCCEALKEKWLRLEQEFDEDGVDELAARGLVDPLTERHMAATTEPEPEPKSKLSALRKILSAH